MDLKDPSASLPVRTIIALGGGGFSEGTEPELDVYVLQQSPAPRPRIGFIATASGDADNYLVKFYRRFASLHCQPAHLSLFHRTPDLDAWVASQDIIYVGGGNTRSMLAVWHAWGLAGRLAAALSAGTLLVGVSAGAICWFEHGVTDSNAGALSPLACLGMLRGSCCPHYSNEAERKPAYARLVATGEIPEGMAIDDGAAIHFRNGLPHKVVVGNASASAYRVTRAADGVNVQPIGVETLNV